MCIRDRFHSAIYPPLDLVKKHPRYTVVVDTVLSKRYVPPKVSSEFDPTVESSQQVA